MLQLLGLETAALNTVQFSNHSGYRQLKGFQTTGEQITELYEGLKMNKNDDFEMLLTGYIPGAESVEAVGRVAKELKEKREGKGGGLFWGMFMIFECFGQYGLNLLVDFAAFSFGSGYGRPRPALCQ